ncbi:hypothetical protein HK104_009985, partial [Borealophlyctis nickersoniae]
PGSLTMLECVETIHIWRRCLRSRHQTEPEKVAPHIEVHRRQVEPPALMNSDTESDGPWSDEGASSSSPEYVCSACPLKVFPSERAARKHIDDKHKCGSFKNPAAEVAKDPKKYPCRDCGKVFKSMSALGGHASSAHPKEKEYLCKIPTCGKSFATGAALGVSTNPELFVRSIPSELV